MKKMSIEKDELLSKLKELLKDELSTISYETWIIPLGIESIKDDHIVFTVTSDFQRDFIENQFKSLIFNTLRYITNKEWTYSVVEISDETKAMLDRQHLAKIDLADEILVINVDGFIGDSTRNEIAYAKAKGKGVNYLE